MDTCGHCVENSMLNRRNKSRPCWRFVRNNGLMLLVLVGVVFGFGLGFGIRGKASPNAVMWLALPGDVYMRLLKMSILPLVISSIITGTSTLDGKSSGKIGLLSIIFIITVNTCGAILGLITFFIFKPGKVDGKESEGGLKEVQLGTDDMFADLIRNIFPDNMVTACFSKAQTQYTSSTITRLVNGTNITSVVYTRHVGSSSGANILGLILICTVFGMATTRTADHVKKPFVDFFASVSEIVIIVLHWIIWFTPVGVASLVAASIASVTDVEDIFTRVGMFVLAHALAILAMVALQPLVYFLFIRTNPFPFLLDTIKPVMTAIAPPASAIAMPIMISMLEERHQVDRRVTRFMVPLNTALVRCGSCVFICLSVMFLMGLEGRDISVVDVLLTGILTAASSLAIPSVPSASIIIILVILSSLDVQTLNIGLLMALEWLNDRVRTIANVEFELLGPMLVQKFCKKTLSKSKVDINNKEDMELEVELDRTVEIDGKVEVNNKDENGLLLSDKTDKECTSCSNTIVPC